MSLPTPDQFGANRRITRLIVVALSELREMHEVWIWIRLKTLVSLRTVGRYDETRSWSWQWSCRAQLGDACVGEIIRSPNLLTPNCIKRCSCAILRQVSLVP